MFWDVERRAPQATFKGEGGFIIRGAHFAGCRAVTWAHFGRPVHAPLTSRVAAPEIHSAVAVGRQRPDSQRAFLSSQKGATDWAVCLCSTHDVAWVFTTHAEGEDGIVLVHIGPTPVGLSEPRRRSGAPIARRWLSRLRIGRISRARRLRL